MLFEYSPSAHADYVAQHPSAPAAASCMRGKDAMPASQAEMGNRSKKNVSMLCRVILSERC